MTLNIESTVTLNNGVEMPIFGLGTYLTDAATEAEQAARAALDAGYRAIDTAALYRNEAEVGKAVHESDVAREDVFITTKCWTSDLTYKDAHKAFDASLKRLGMETIDLYLIHWPYNDWQGAWRAFEEIYESGRARAIGISNFMQHHIDELLSFAKVRPTVNQYEMHPHLQQPDLHKFCRDNDIYVTAWAPIKKGQVLQMPKIVEIGNKYGKTAVHVTLRWMLQTEVITIPKSAKPARIVENANIFDFELTAEEIDTINNLDRNDRVGPHPDNFGN